jgi:hypothetical protein
LPRLGLLSAMGTVVLSPVGRRPTAMAIQRVSSCQALPDHPRRDSDPARQPRSRSAVQMAVASPFARSAATCNAAGAVCSSTSIWATAPSKALKRGTGSALKRGPVPRQVRTAGASHHSFARSLGTVRTERISVRSLFCARLRVSFCLIAINAGVSLDTGP